MAITALPTPPSRGNDPATFSTRADALLGALPTFVIEANALQEDVNAKQVDVADRATAAAGSAAAANAVALASQYQGAWDAGTTYATGQSVLHGGMYWLSGIDGNIGNTPGAHASWSVVKSNAIARSARTSSVVITAADVGALIDITSGTFTQTFGAAATLGAGWFCYLKNSGDGDITLDPAGAETIDGLASFVMYPGEVRLIQCDGTALRSVVLNAFHRTFTASGTFTKPPGYRQFAGLLWGGGGSGGVGHSGAGYRAGGGGGGGCRPLHLSASAVAATVSVVIGSGGASVTTVGTSGNDGGASNFGDIAVGGGGGGRYETSESLYRGGGGGGVITSAAGDTTAYPDGASTSAGLQHRVFGGGLGGGSNVSPAAAGGGSVYGGGGGGASNLAAGTGGGASALGGAGGGRDQAGAIPSGGGGASTSTSGAGARGELCIWGLI